MQNTVSMIQSCDTYPFSILYQNKNKLVFCPSCLQQSWQLAVLQVFADDQKGALEVGCGWCSTAVLITLQCVCWWHCLSGSVSAEEEQLLFKTGVIQYELFLVEASERAPVSQEHTVWWGNKGWQARGVHTPVALQQGCDTRFPLCLHPTCKHGTLCWLIEKGLWIILLHWQSQSIL